MNNTEEILPYPSDGSEIISAESFYSLQACTDDPDFIDSFLMEMKGEVPVTDDWVEERASTITALNAAVTLGTASGTETSKPLIVLSNTIQHTNPGRLKIINVEAHGELHESTLVAMLDSGAQVSFITKNALQKIFHTVIGTRDIQINGAAGRSSAIRTDIVKIILQPRGLAPLPVTCFVYDNFVSSFENPELPVSDKDFIKSRGYTLNSASGNISPDLLIGIGAYYQIVREHLVQLPSGLELVSTVFGAVACGMGSEDNSDELPLPVNTFTTTMISDFTNPFGLEAQGISEDPSPAAETDLNEAIMKRVRNEAEFRNGNIYIKLPWKDDHPYLADNEQMAYKRLQTQYSKLSGNKALWDKYHENFMEQLRAGIIELAPETKSSNYYCIPHQGVLKESSLTTKLRIVLDASSHKNGEIALNDAVHAGPVILPDILGLQMRMREHDFLMTADIEKAFHQIFLSLADRDSCTIMWLKNHRLPPSPDNIIMYRYTRLPFGVNASPFLLAMGITIFLEKLNHPLKDKILRDMYVDNLFIGCKSSEECFKVYKETKELFNWMKMNLREYATNCSVTRSLLDLADQTSSPIESKLLGLPWNTETDVITIPFKLPVITGAYTKRSLLRAYAKTFDPLGLLAPVTISFKIVLSEIFRLPGGWDDSVPAKFPPIWEKLVKTVEGLQQSFPRKVTVSASDSAKCSLVIFADASAIAYGVAAYVVTTFSDGRPTTSELLTAKSRVTSVGSTIPRSELVGIWTAAKIAKFTCEQMETRFDNIYILSDSMIALNWTKKQDIPKPFVFNRVQSIRTISENLETSGRTVEFLHTRTDENPADATSRGLTASEFAAYEWNHGPKWLLRPRSTWPVDCLDFVLPSELEREYMCEIKTVVGSIKVSKSFTEGSCIPFYASKDVRRIEGITLAIVRWIQLKIRKLPAGPERNRWYEWLPLLKTYSNNKRNAETSKLLCTTLLKEHQKVMASQIDKFEYKRDLEKDRQGVLRYRGRMGNSHKHPALIDSDHPYGIMLLEEAHLASGHGGDVDTLSQLRQDYWLVNAQVVAARKVTKSCVHCIKSNARPYKYPPAPQLPSSRTTASRPFQECGLDYAGPIPIKMMKGTSEKAEGKAWLLLITCLTTRAVHLELVSSNDTLEFVIALNKFFSRYGIPDSFVLDNAPTFKAGASVINEYLNSQASFEELDIGNQLGPKAFLIKWLHITPHSPWKGGVYERMVALVKNCLKKSLGPKILDFRSLEMTLLQVEDLVNRRPITKSSNDARDHLALRPIDLVRIYAHAPFAPRTPSTDPDYTPNTLDSPNAVQEFFDSASSRLDTFWKLWNKAYLSQLRDMNRIRQLTRGEKRSSPSVGDVVLCTDENLPRDRWKMAIVLRTNVSEDGLIRSVLIKNIKCNEVEKSVNQLVPLEISCIEDPNRTVEAPEEPEKRVPRSTRKKVDYCETGRRKQD